jgi:hypothetical protein
LLICAFNTAFMCRVSTQITGKPASASALKSHCDSGPASNPIRLKWQAGFVSTASSASGSLDHLHFPHHPARVIHDADARLLDRNV